MIFITFLCFHSVLPFCASTPCFHGLTPKAIIGKAFMLSQELNPPCLSQAFVKEAPVHCLSLFPVLIEHHISTRIAYFRGGGGRT
ncbi:hypothetical protein ES705_34516 [subsurface metagenome]